MWDRFKCWIGLHDPEKWQRGTRMPLRCLRCRKIVHNLCGNCGSVHDPNAFITICTVTRSGW